MSLDCAHFILYASMQICAEHAPAYLASSLHVFAQMVTSVQHTFRAQLMADWLELVQPALHVAAVTAGVTTSLIFSSWTNINTNCCG